jgi:signal transduction histidine kinase
VRVGGRPQGRHDSTGLGLTFCRLAVEAHGGMISVASQVGVGTTFRLELLAI